MTNEVLADVVNKYIEIETDPIYLNKGVLLKKSGFLDVEQAKRIVTIFIENNLAEQVVLFIDKFSINGRFFEMAKFNSLISEARVNEAFTLPLSETSNLPNKLICSKIDLLLDVCLLKKNLKKLCAEKFNGFTPTCIDDLMYRLYRQNRGKYNQYKDMLSDFLDEVNYYTKASLGLLDELDFDFIKEVVETNNKVIILRVFSSFSHHQNNIRSLIKSGHLDLLHHPILSLAYKEVLNNVEIIRSPSLFRKKPKIALCVSGQLRGYQKAHKSWVNAGLGDFDVDTYVCVWKDVGRKKFDGNKHLNRFFRADIAKLFMDLLFNKSRDYLENTFPSLVEYLNQKVDINLEVLKSTYSTENINIVNDDEYSNMSNTEKMYFMIDKCWGMIKKPEDYDAIIRIRPDKEILKFDFDFDIIKNNKNILIADKKSSIHMGDIYMGDQFAISNPQVMRVYSLLYSNYLQGNGSFSINEYQSLKPHTSLFATMLFNAISVVDMREVLEFGSLLDPDVITEASLLELLNKDRNSLNDKFINEIEKVIGYN